MDIDRTQSEEALDHGHDAHTEHEVHAHSEHHDDHGEEHS